MTTQNGVNKNHFTFLWKSSLIISIVFVSAWAGWELHNYYESINRLDTYGIQHDSIFNSTNRYHIYREELRRQHEYIEKHRQQDRDSGLTPMPFWYYKFQYKQLEEELRKDMIR